MTVRLILKALRLLWPYVRSAIFRDRTVIEVIIENLHITIMLGLIIILVVMLSITTLQLSDIKEARELARHRASSSVTCDCNDNLNTNRLKELIKEYDNEY